ncbi:MAG: erythromycin esterase family protein [Gemmataceae bacterium]
MVASLDEWITREALVLGDLAAIDRVVAALGDEGVLLGLGEALHGGEEVLTLRNQWFERLVEKHRFSAIAVESCYVRAARVNGFIQGDGPATFEEVREEGFSQGLGQLESNRELAEWMRRWNARPGCAVPLRFYGFDIPMGALGMTGPRRVLETAVEYLARVEPALAQAQRARIEPHLLSDAAWENPAMYTDPSQSVGQSAEAAALRVAVEELLAALRLHRPALVAATGEESFAEAVRHAELGRDVLTYHAALARNVGMGPLLGWRDAVMADNLMHLVERERGRGRILVFAHNAHLQRGKKRSWSGWHQALGVEPFAWWPAGAHLDQRLGARYAVIGTGVGVSEANGIAAPEAGTLEARLGARLIPTHRGARLAGEEVAALPTRSGSGRNLSYTPLEVQSLSDFDWLGVLGEVTYWRGGRPLPG